MSVFIRPNYRRSPSIVNSGQQVFGNLPIGDFCVTPGCTFVSGGMAMDKELRLDSAARLRIRKLAVERCGTLKKASLLSGLNETYVSQLTDPAKNKGGNAQALSALAKTLGVSVDYLLTGRNATVTLVPHSPGAEVAGRIDDLPDIPVRGVTAAGQWMQIDADFEDHPEIVAVATRFRGAQFAYKVQGPSMDKRRIFHGDYVICVDAYEFGRSPANGHVVVVERRHPVKGVERTVKELEISEGKFLLWPRSTNPAPIYQEPLIVDPNDMAEPDGTEVEIVGVVIKVQSEMNYA